MAKLNQKEIKRMVESYLKRAHDSLGYSYHNNIGPHMDPATKYPPEKKGFWKITGGIQGFESDGRTPGTRYEIDKIYSGRYIVAVS